MKFTCDKNDFNNSINIVSRAISSRTTLQSLEGIYIETFNEKIKLTCYDMTIGIETIFDASVIEPGVALVPGRIFSELIRKLPEGEIKFEFIDNVVHIDYGYSSTNIQLLNYEEFPTLPHVIEDDGIIIKEHILKNLITSTLFSVALDESRPVLMGALFDINENNIQMVTLDGYRLAKCEVTLGDSYKSNSVIVPASTLSEVQKLLIGEDSIIIYINSSHIQFKINNTKIISRLIEGEFIKHDKIIPKLWETRMKVAISDIKSSIDRASIMLREDDSVITMDISQNKLTITSQSEIGNVHEENDILLDGKNIKISFNVKYIFDVLKNINSEIENLYFCFTTNSSPCIIKGVENNDYLYLVLPIRMYD